MYERWYVEAPSWYILVKRSWHNIPRVWRGWDEHMVWFKHGWTKTIGLSSGKILTSSVRWVVVIVDGMWLYVCTTYLPSNAWRSSLWH